MQSEVAIAAVDFAAMSIMRMWSVTSWFVEPVGVPDFTIIAVAVV